MEEKQMSNVNMIPQYDTKLFTDVFDDAGTFVYHYKHIGIPTTISEQNAFTLYYLLYARYGNTPIANYDETQFIYKIFSVVFQYGPTWEKRLSVQQTLRDMQLSDLVDNGALEELFSSSGSSSSTSSGTSGNTRTLNTQETNTGTQGVTHTGTATVASTGTQGVTHTGTSTDASTGTQAIAHTGTVGVVHDNDVQNSGNDTTINNHAFNPGTAPAVNAYDPLTYINEQNAEKITKGTKSEQDESSTTTYQNTDTTTNNLQNQKTNNLTDTTTNNLQNQTTNDLTDTTTNNLTKADTGTITDSGTTGNQVSGQESRSNSTTTTMTAGKLKAYEKLLELLDSDVTGEFISKFKICFKQFVMPERTWIYVTEDDEDDEE